MELEFQQRRIARGQYKEKLENDKKNKQYKCAISKERLGVGENSHGIKKYDQASGKWIIVENEHHPAIIA
jgi:hypothetical protein